MFRTCWPIRIRRAEWRTGGIPNGPRRAAPARGERDRRLRANAPHVSPFSEKQIELVTTFAAQAVIAIENTRLFEAEQQRSRELTESLAQQTATSEVLKIVSSSPGELEPVFNAMLETATRVCGAQFGVLYRFEDKKFRPTALVNAPPVYADFVEKRGPFVPQAGNALDHVMRTRQTSNSIDKSAESNPPRRRNLQERDRNS